MLKDRPGRDRAASFRLYFISIPLGDAKFVTKEGRSAGQPLILIRTRNLGRFVPKFLAPAEGWWPSATNWQGLIFYVGDDHLVRFSVFFVMVYFVFFCQSIFHGENCETKSAVLTANSSFFIFSKN